jgi:CRISPR-associated protein Cas2
MMVLVSYDVNTSDSDGAKRLRHVARICKNYGIRVQMSVFECQITPAQRVEMEDEIRKVIDENQDSVRIYDMGNNVGSHITHIGVKKPVDLDGVMIF